MPRVFIREYGIQATESLQTRIDEREWPSVYRDQNDSLLGVVSQR